MAHAPHAALRAAAWVPACAGTTRWRAKTTRWGAGATKLVVAGLFALMAAACTAPPPPTPPAPQRSGFLDMSPATQALQRDDAANPAMLWVQDGQRLWSQPAGPQGRSCASCHGGVERLRGVAARYPAWDPVGGQPVNLGMRIGLCRQRHQGLPPWPAGHEESIALEMLVGLQSRGLPIAPPADARLAPARQLGAALWTRRLGQLELSCAQCHDERAGGRLGGTVIPQGQATAYPIYRLEWQAPGTLARRVRGCLAGVRAEPFAPHGQEQVALELHLAQRALGMAVETPGVRP